MKILKNNRGLTIPLVLVVLSIVTIFGFVTLSITSNQAKFNIIDNSSKKALEYAEAGYNQYLWYLNDELNFYSTAAHEDLMNKPIEFEEGYYVLDVTKPSDADRFVTIKSTGWTKENPTIKRTILAKIRKKQFVHHVYVSDDDGPNIWWTTGDESHGPLHTNKDIRIQNRPIFYDTVSYVNKLERGTGYNPDFKVQDPSQPMQTKKLEFPASNKNLKDWAEKDDMVFYGRTCIFLDGDTVKIRNQNSDEIITRSISKDIQNLVIYVDKVPDNDKSVKGGTGKFGIRSGNVFVSGNLKGKLTIGAEDSIYITYSDPTNWYDYDTSDMYNKNNKPNQPPTSFSWGGKNNRTYPEIGGVEYSNTWFSGNKNGTGTAMSSYDSEKKIYTRYSFDKNDSKKPGKDMLGLIANNEILILHYGWPKKAYDSDGKDDIWDFEWEWRNWGWWLSPDYKWGKVSKTYDMAPHDVTINAALFSVNEGFGYEEHGKGPRKGDIILWGNITQKERKAVGTIGSTGYNKKYAHDPRMFYDYPPHILEPINVGWEIHEWKEINE
ncbi:hypothetical protein [Proteiniborus sp. MB09-C3]|uniref:hypothetical protein n=1 Tax=Proteiniborus sp. MB09-C3 TaxID=3050072 RepID=UPI00255723ED|nr:hypothetical protein [Proteiniborus sp. MB09-C3]WIV11016.1 hypothetical protein QO263_12735 [Proteiniborus sp. MB09-C3]